MSQPRKINPIFLTQEHKNFLKKYFDRYLESETARDRRVVANTAADALITQFAVVRKEEAQALRAVRSALS